MLRICDMKTLILMRHAKAKDGKKNEDKKRPLTAKGFESARSVCDNIVSIGCMPAAIASSDARRAYDTAKILSKAAGKVAAEIDVLPQLYEEFTSEMMFDYISGLHDGFSTAVIVGHNPGIKNVVKELFPDVTHLMSPSSAAIIGFGVDSWKDIRSAAPVLLSFKIPFDSDGFNDLQSQMFPALSSEIEDCIMRKIKDLPWPAGKQLKKHVSACAGSIARKTLKNMRVITMNMKKVGGV